MQFWHLQVNKTTFKLMWRVLEGDVDERGLINHFHITVSVLGLAADQQVVAKSRLSDAALNSDPQITLVD